MLECVSLIGCIKFVQRYAVHPYVLWWYWAYARASVYMRVSVSFDGMVDEWLRDAGRMPHPHTTTTAMTMPSPSPIIGSEFNASPRPNRRSNPLPGASHGFNPDGLFLLPGCSQAHSNTAPQPPVRSMRIPVANEHGYQQVHGRSLRRPQGLRTSYFEHHSIGRQGFTPFSFNTSANQQSASTDRQQHNECSMHTAQTRQDDVAPPAPPAPSSPACRSSTDLCHTPHTRWPIWVRTLRRYIALGRGGDFAIRRRQMRFRCVCLALGLEGGIRPS